ncbi:Aromatic-L-amino-acid decarboxylase [Aphelenchoides besseyi]|nr:Aromatic-L-amino-acid decarboxylase [Aphelenchoides besseyi]KAI6211111.1 Aromatic-L-amino-acid decarboxylase [Aphelenchoides besseyi]
MVYPFGEVFNNFNNYCQDKTTKLKQSFSPNRSTTASPLNSATSDLEPSPSSSSSTSMAAMHGSNLAARAPASVASNPPAPPITPQQIPKPIQPNSLPLQPPPLPKRTKPKTENAVRPEQVMQNLSDQMSKLKPNDELPRRTSAPGTFGDLQVNVLNRRYSEEYRDRNYQNSMTPSDFRRVGRQTVDYIADYMENVHNRRVVPSIEPGYLRELLPATAPQQPESFEKVMHDFESYVMPGVTHWQHPRFHAYFPAANSYPSVLATMLSDALGANGFSWASCPAITELETIMLQWFGEMIGLPKEFLPFTEEGRGGGVIQGSASECNFVALLAARFEIMKELRQRFPFVEEGLLMSKLIAYCSKEAHSSVEKAAMIGMVKLRILETDSKFRMRGDTLQAAITEDRNLGMIPFFVSVTLGTTSVCSFDALSEIGPVCMENDLWLHVDAAYAGSAFICPEFRYLMSGIEYAMSFNTNPNKWMLVNFDCSTFWVKDRFKLTQALVVDPLYLQHSWTDKAIDYRHWGIPLSRRFRSLKLWFVVRMYGVEGLQKYIRNHVRLAKKFESLIKADDRFEIVGDVIMGLVCFRLKGTNEANQNLLTKLNSSGRIHMVPASLSDRFVIRFCVCHEHANDHDIYVAYEIIKQTAITLLYEQPEPIVENYELEKLEEKAYALDGSFDEPSVDSPRSLVNGVFADRDSISSSSGRDPNFVENTHQPHPGVYQTQTSTGSAGSTSTNPSGNGDRRRFGQSLAEKRSFLVRMVSDPKCYNPKIVRHLNMRNHKQMSQDLFRDRTLREAIESGTAKRPSRIFPGNFTQYSVDHTDEDHEYSNSQALAPTETGIQTPL